MELWRPITGHPNYEISSRGQLRSTFRGRPRILRRTVGRSGYVLVQMGATKTALAHRLVAAAFLPPPLPHQTCVNHKNGVKDDNRVENLEWCSQRENQLHAYATGLQSPLGPPLRLTHDEAEEIRFLYKHAKLAQAEIAREYGCAQITVSRIVNRVRGYEVV